MMSDMSRELVGTTASPAGEYVRRNRNRRAEVPTSARACLQFYRARSEEFLGWLPQLANRLLGQLDQVPPDFVDDMVEQIERTEASAEEMVTQLQGFVAKLKGAKARLTGVPSWTESSISTARATSATASGGAFHILPAGKI